jgi:uncharacterized membrane protein
MTDQHLESVWYSPSPWWHSGMKVAALILLLNALALEWAVLLRPELGWPAVVWIVLSLPCAALLGAWSTVQTDAK